MGQSDPGSAPAPLLTPEQLAEYRATGILLLRGFLPADTAARLRVAALDEIPALDPLVKGKWMHFHEPGPGGEGRMLCRTENFVDHADLAGAFSPGGKLHRAVEEVAGEPMVLFKDKINYKQPGAAGFAPHQDSPAFTSTPTTHLTALVPVHPMTRANGCLEFVPGAFPGVLPQEADGTISRAWCAEREWVALECGEGDVVLFSGLVPHRSGPNATEGGRAAYYLTYNAAKEGDNRAAYWDAKRRHFPPRNEREEGKDYSEGAKMYNLGNPIVD
ncbi:hypothetical protein DFJ74DRAFT_693691 [Hyaloraphidium curvatum]|nr:hypothetical protein DFJ74DRAFT_693691 [Hyaloraphidium curvatum]